jgi:hypothetical protein
MKYFFIVAFLSITVIASSGLKKPFKSWRELRVQQQADSAAYQAVYTIDSIRRAKRHLK